jgi:hypothetical protein
MIGPTSAENSGPGSAASPLGLLGGHGRAGDADTGGQTRAAASAGVSRVGIRAAVGWERGPGCARGYEIPRSGRSRAPALPRGRPRPLPLPALQPPGGRARPGGAALDTGLPTPP